MANPFEVQTINPLQALLVGDQAYQGAQKTQQENAKRTALASLLQGSGMADPNQVASTLLSTGDTSGAATFANLAAGNDQRTYQRGRDTTLDARHEREYAQDLALRKAAAARAGEDKPLIKEVTDPNTGQTQFYRINPRSGEASVIAPAGGAAPSQPANPFAYGKQNEGQSKDSGYANRLFDAENVLRDPAVIDAGKSIMQKGKEAVPVVGGYLTSPDRQKYDQASRNFINGVLRRESGAAISQSEFDNAYKQYIPQPFDSPEKLAEKQRNRQATIASIAGGGGQSYRPPFTFGPNGEMVPTGAGKQGAQAQKPTRGDPLAMARDAIQRGADPEAVKQRLQQNGINPSGL